jgi:excisionase family DNA binding protein
MAEGKKIFTIKEVSEISGISESEVIRLVMIKKIPVIRIGKAIRIKEEDLNDFLSGFTGREEAAADYREPVLYTAEQVARILKLSVDNVWSLLKTGSLKGFKIREGRSSWRVPAGSLDDFIEARIRRTK